MPAVFHTIHSHVKKEKRTKKERMLLLLLLKLILNSIGVTIRGKGVRGRGPIGKVFKIHNTSLTQEHILRSLWLFILLSAVLCASPAQADFTNSDWQFFKAIDSSSAHVGGYVCFSLDGEVFHQARLSLADVRILDDQQKEVPYALFEPRETISEEQYTPRIFNQAVLPKAYSTLTLDLGQETYNNKLVLKTRSKNFKRRVEIAGSADARRWFVLKNNAYIFDFSGEQKIQLTTITYPENNYRYLQVKVWNGPEPPLALEGADLFLVKTETP